MTDVMPSEKVADKIRKLLNLAQGGATEGEAALAMEKVQELLAQYNLTMNDVNAKQTDDERGQDEVSWNAMYEYQQKLMGVIAECHYCIHWITKKARKGGKRNTPKAHHVLIGRKVNVASAIIMFDYLNTTINRLVQDVYPAPSHMGRSAMSWKEGCAVRLCERLRERKQQADEEQARKVEEEKKRAAHPAYAGSKNALVLLTDVRQDEADANYEMRWGLEPGTLRSRRMEAVQQRNALAARANELEAAGEDRRIVDWVRQGVTEATARRWLEEAKEAAKTPEQLAREAERAAHKWQREQEREARRQERADAKRDWSAYAQGRETAEDVGLDKQIDKSNLKKLS